MPQLRKISSNVVYVACGDERSILALELSPGARKGRVLQKVFVPGPAGPSITSMPLALHPTKNLLYVAVRMAQFSVSCFAVDPLTGKIEFRATEHLTENVVFMKIDRSGNFLLTVSYSESTINIYRLDKDGGVSQEPLMQFKTPLHPHSAVFDLSNRFLYVPCLGADLILNYGFDADRGIAFARPSCSIFVQSGAGPRHQALHPNGRYLFVLNELAASISVLDLVTSHRSPASIVQTVKLDVRNGDSEYAAADIHITPLGRFLYASERNSNLLTGFAVDPDTGSLARIGAWETEASPRSLAIDPAGQMLVVAGQISNHLSVYHIESRSGHLTWLFRQATPANPSWIEIAPLSAPSILRQLQGRSDEAHHNQLNMLEK